VARAERFNAVTHLAGAVLAAVGFGVLVVPAVARGRVLEALGFAVYGVSLFLVFLASTLYHVAGAAQRERWRCWDRAAIYVLIAGTYTPLALLKLPPRWGWPLMAAVWGLAAGGAASELLPARRRAVPEVTSYLVMGWMAMVAVVPLVDSLTIPGTAWLGAGGVIFTAGALTLRFDLLPRAHEVWHVLVLAGSACHFLAMLLYVS
jgi:hemolysin III